MVIAPLRVAPGGEVRLRRDHDPGYTGGGVNPQAVEVRAFKQPSAEGLNHDFLWRYQCPLPGRGRIGIFNRSHYEEVLVVRVHEELLGA
jgi:polyphosphate kinase 2 (PPK2 family)